MTLAMIVGGGVLALVFIFIAAAAMSSPAQAAKPLTKHLLGHWQQVPESERKAIAGLVQGGRKIQAIKMLRESTGLSLVEAKAIADHCSTGDPLEFISFSETLALLGIDENELKRRVTNGELKGYRYGAQMSFKRSEIEALL